MARIEGLHKILTFFFKIDTQKQTSSPRNHVLETDTVEKENYRRGKIGSDPDMSRILSRMVPHSMELLGIVLLCKVSCCLQNGYSDFC